MNYKVELTGHFKKEAKRLIKKYHSLKCELAALFQELEKTQQLRCILQMMFIKFD